VILIKTGKKFLYYDLKPTLEIAIQHSKIQALVESTTLNPAISKELTIPSARPKARATLKQITPSSRDY